MNKKAKNISFGRKLLFSTIMFLFVVLILEGLIRGFYFVWNKKLPRVIDFSEELGWVSVGNLEMSHILKGYGEVHYSTTQHGFRVFGDVSTTKTKIFVIGDSQTQARKVSDGETYYDYIGQHTESEIFAYGGGGYGTLQEYMILDRFVDLIQPDIILWQFCANDIIDNSWALESSSWKNNNHMTRPYYEAGKIRHRFPHSSGIYRNILRHSYLVKLFNIKLDILLIENLGPVPSEILRKGHPVFEEAVNTTAEIMKLVKDRAKKAPIAAFSACGEQSFIHDICNSLDIFYIAGIVDAVKKAKNSGMVVDGEPYDTHWNNNANAIAGKIIVEYLIAKELIRRSEVLGNDFIPRASASTLSNIP